ncbi:MAG: hypothetical protein KZQ77_04935, partial [Candidatus Thiodiazotropha sp. (ex Notomyrtea botanica)]|nr:hypothetical protein [Candidatus Thiodiazotropha sp. (ex Notomyrtea botanica)]
MRAFKDSAAGYCAKERRTSRHFFASILLIISLFCSTSQAEQITLNLNNADIEALIKTVSEHTGKNFVIDPRVKGKVTVISGVTRVTLSPTETPRISASSCPRIMPK